jgi:hypothetical protein
MMFLKMESAFGCEELRMNMCYICVMYVCAQKLLIHEAGGKMIFLKKTCMFLCVM